jgi:transcriptional regulator PpsR
MESDTVDQKAARSNPAGTGSADATPAATAGSEFHAPLTRLNLLGTDQQRRMLAASADLTLVLASTGVVLDVAAADPDLGSELGDALLGMTLADLVGSESLPKVTALMAGTWSGSSPVPGAPPRWRQLSLRVPPGPEFPLSCSSVQVERPAAAATDDQPQPAVIVFCRDLRALSAMQQRLVEAQQSMERDYLRFRQAETRYRHLFQVSAEGVMVVDAASMRIVEANPAAQQLLSPQSTAAPAADKLVGVPFPTGFDRAGQDAVIAMLSTVRASGRVEEVRCELAEQRGELTVAASVFRQEDGTYFLVRLARAADPVGAAELLNTNAMLLKLAQSAPDCLVVTDLEGNVLSANTAFVELVQLANEDQVRGQPLDRWLGRTGVDLSVLISNLRQRGSVRLFGSTLRGAFGAQTDVEISATLVPHGTAAFLGFTIRDVGRRLSADSRTRKELPRSVAQLTELVGRVPLKDIVGETTDLIEQMCIEAALELTRDNRASAAEMLGLSRQSLYVKLRRYGLGDLSNDADKTAG